MWVVELFRWLVDRIVGPKYEQLADPFVAEILLDDRVVGILTDRQWVDMFWFSYRVEAIGDAVFDDDLWSHVRFQFRDPATGRVCTGAFAGPPRVRDNRVTIRAMYFEGLRRWRRRSRLTSCAVVRSRGR